MNKQSKPKTSREDENLLYLKNQYKGTCTTCRIYRHKGKSFCHIEGANIPKFYYCDKPEHVKKYYQKIIKEEKSWNNKNNYFKMKNHQEKDFYKKK